MEIWAGIIGVVIGGLLTLLGGFIESGKADRRLKVQLEHADKQREHDRRIGVRNEAADHLGALIKILTETLPSITKSTSKTALEEAVFITWSAAMQRAMVAMTAVGDKAAIANLRIVQGLSLALYDAEDIDAAAPYLRQVTAALAAVERDYTRLKLGDSTASP